jgi:hypothetical protein
MGARCLSVDFLKVGRRHGLLLGAHHPRGCATWLRTLARGRCPPRKRDRRKSKEKCVEMLIGIEGSTFTVGRGGPTLQKAGRVDEFGHSSDPG